MNRSYRRGGNLPALIVACIALVVALSGNAWATARSPSTIRVVHGNITHVDRGAINTSIVSCPEGYKALSGGYQVFTGNIVGTVAAAVNRTRDAYFAAVEVPPTQIGAPTKEATFNVSVMCARAGVPIVP